MTRGVLTGLSDADLEGWLAEIRRVAGLSPDEALAGTDTSCGAYNNGTLGVGILMTTL